MHFLYRAEQSGLPFSSFGFCYQEAWLVWCNTGLVSHFLSFFALTTHTLHPLMQSDVSSSACLTCFLLRLDRAVQGSDADSRSEEDEMKRRKESRGLPTTKPSSLDPSHCLQFLTFPLPPADVFGLLPCSPDGKPFWF